MRAKWNKKENTAHNGLILFSSLEYLSQPAKKKTHPSNWKTICTFAICLQNIALSKKINEIKNHSSIRFQLNFLTVFAVRYGVCCILCFTFKKFISLVKFERRLLNHRIYKYYDNNWILFSLLFKIGK